MTKPSNLVAIEATTGRSWNGWVRWLENVQAAQLSHPELADILRKELHGAVENPGWWAQSIAVAYEQHIGKRKPGQVVDGTYEVSVTKSVVGDVQNVFVLWREAYEDATKFRGLKVSNIRTSDTPVRTYWRCDLADGSRLTIAVEERVAGKAMVTANHTKIKNEDEKEYWRVFWKEALKKL